MASETIPPAVREILSRLVLPPELNQILVDELVQSWADGMRDGLELAATMAQGIVDHEKPTADQKVVAAGLRDALRESVAKVRPPVRAVTP